MAQASQWRQLCPKPVVRAQVQELDSDWPNGLLTGSGLLPFDNIPRSSRLLGGAHVLGKLVGVQMKPFDDYPDQGRVPLGSPRHWSNCRWGYGLELMRRTGQTSCAYCGVDLVADYHRWLLMAVDHVIPRNQAELVGVMEYLHDMTNLVLCCAGCNSFANRYRVPPNLLDGLPISKPDRFFTLRDRVFADRSQVIEQRRAIEIARFKETPWQNGRA